MTKVYYKEIPMTKLKSGYWQAAYSLPNLKKRVRGCGKTQELCHKSVQQFLTKNKVTNTSIPKINKLQSHKISKPTKMQLSINQSSIQQFLAYQENITKQFFDHQLKILEIITNLQVTDQVTEVTDQVTEVTDQVTEVTDQVTEVTDQVTEVTDQVTEVTDQVTKVTDQVTEVTDQVTEVTESPRGEKIIHTDIVRVCASVKNATQEEKILVGEFLSYIQPKLIEDTKKEITNVVTNFKSFNVFDEKATTEDYKALLYNYCLCKPVITNMNAIFRATKEDKRAAKIYHDYLADDLLEIRKLFISQNPYPERFMDKMIRSDYKTPGGEQYSWATWSTYWIVAGFLVNEFSTSKLRLYSDETFGVLNYKEWFGDITTGKTSLREIGDHYDNRLEKSISDADTVFHKILKLIKS
jgi:uncharacterized protein Yka (UPF0111/DUF47 family)